ncbi:MAG: hypothetical protein OEX02_11935 [Cyclobacteriaceae bacterium]|nr:hypothetical protein [Cyclobacteriaceae bacterium]
MLLLNLAEEFLKKIDEKYPVAIRTVDTKVKKAPEVDIKDIEAEINGPATFVFCDN